MHFQIARHEAPYLCNALPTSWSYEYAVDWASVIFRQGPHQDTTYQRYNFRFDKLNTWHNALDRGYHLTVLQHARRERPISNKKLGSTRTCSLRESLPYACHKQHVASRWQIACSNGEHRVRVTPFKGWMKWSKACFISSNVISPTVWTSQSVVGHRRARSNIFH